MALSLRRNFGHQRAFALRGGFDAWKNAGLPLEPRRAAGAAHAPSP